MPRQPRREEYTVGWVCALSIERAAAIAMLDKEYGVIDDGSNDHESAYYTGSIAVHNVAIACLPAGLIGTNSAAVVVTQMRATFSGLRFVLMVGIGGGVPSAENNIRLGDVVVSQPYKKFGGVVQYDMGKTTTDGFERTGSLNSPPRILLNAVSCVQTNQFLGRSMLSSYGSKLECLTEFDPTKRSPDILFNADYDHKGGSKCKECEGCDIGRQQARLQRKSGEEVVVHYGTIASGNQVIKTATQRDKISDNLGGVLCFEMEAAGIMNVFPCLVIRGICDYADSHKNKSWQPYAAGTAAAYAKEVLSVIPLIDAAKQRPIRGVVEEDSVDFTNSGDSTLVGALEDLAQRNSSGLNWQNSVSDLLELLDLQSEKWFCDWLAEKLHVCAGASGSPKQNKALHEAIMSQIVRGELDWNKMMKLRATRTCCLNCGGPEHRKKRCPNPCGKCMPNASIYGSSVQLTLLYQAYMNRTKH
jgi:nucleoside phosphorylase